MQADLDNIHKLLDEGVVDRLVDIYTLRHISISGDAEFRKVHTSMAQQLCPELNMAPSTSSATVYSRSASART